MNFDPPAIDVDSEIALLGSLILDPANIDRVSPIIEWPDFGLLDHGQLYDALKTLHEAGKPIGDARVLMPALKELHLPETVTSAAFLYKIINGATPWHAAYLAKQIVCGAHRRRLWKLSMDMARRASDGHDSPAEIAAFAESQLAGIGGAPTPAARRVDAVAAEFLDELAKPRATGAGVMTGIMRHDSLVGQWMPGELVILAARPGVGKTAFALQVAGYNAKRNRPALIVSLEMTDRELVSRILCRNGVDSKQVRTGSVGKHELDTMASNALEFADTPLFVHSPYKAGVSQIRAVAKHQRASCGLSLLVVDYIGLVKAEDRSRPRHEQVAAVTGALKAMAKELEVPVLALCQLNREADGNAPILSHLRESGSVEQDADIVVFLHPESKDRSQVKLIVAKHRHGETGMFDLRWNAAETLFSDPGCEQFGRYGG
jgi:replicative DNA helicase